MLYLQHVPAELNCLLAFSAATGPFRPCTLQSKMVRMEAHVAMQPDSLFRLLTSVEGYKILDPYTDNFGQGVVKVGRPVPSPNTEGLAHCTLV